MRLRIFKLMKECKIGYLSSANLRWSSDKPESKRRPLWFMQKYHLLACNSILAALEKEYNQPVLLVDFARVGIERQIHGLFFAEGPRGMLERLKYKSVDMFPFLAGYIDKCTGWIEEALLMEVHVLSSELIMGMARGKGCEE